MTFKIKEIRPRSADKVQIQNSIEAGSDQLRVETFNLKDVTEQGTLRPGHFFPHFQNAGRQDATRESITGDDVSCPKILQFAIG